MNEELKVRRLVHSVKFRQQCRSVDERRERSGEVALFVLRLAESEGGLRDKRRQGMASVQHTRRQMRGS